MVNETPELEEVLTSWETISDDPSTDDNVIVYNDVKPCTHEKLIVGAPPAPGRRFSRNASTARETATSSKFIPYLSGKVRDGSVADWASAVNCAATYSSYRPKQGINPRPTLPGLSLPSSRLGELPARAVRALEELHMTTTTIEARELPELFKLLSPRGSFLRNASRIGRNYLQGRNPGKSMKQLCKLYREGHLAYTFGIMPTVSDMTNIVKSLKNGLKDFKTYKSVTLGGDRSGHKRVSLGDQAWHTNLSMLEEVTHSRTDGVRLLYKKPRNTGEYYDKLLNIWQRTVGCNPMGLIWEVLPFSFAVDWIITIDQLLDLLWLNNQTSYSVQYWTTIKSTYTRTLLYGSPGEAIRNTSGFLEIVGFAQPSNVLTYSHYDRQTVPPPAPMESIQFVKDFSAKKGFLLGLIGMGLRRRG